MIIGLIKTLETEEDCYLIMQLCLTNLDVYLKIRKNGLCKLKLFFDFIS